MGAAAVVELLVPLISQLAQLGEQAYAAEQAGNQAQLDSIHQTIVAASNAMFPPDITPVAVD